MEQEDMTPDQEEMLEKEKQAQLAFEQAANEFGIDTADLIVKYKDKLAMAFMAKQFLSCVVDLLINQSALQAQYTVQQMLTPMFEQMAEANKPKDPSERKIITLG